MKHAAFVALTAALLASPASAQTSGDRFTLRDVFELETASDPQVSPDGRQVVYVRNFFDIMTDRGRSNLWILGADGSGHRALTTGNQSYSSPRWSSDGARLIYVSSKEGGAEIWLRWMDTGQEAKLTNLTHGPGEIAWSPDGRRIAFTMFVPAEGSSSFALAMPRKPEGADWGPAIKVIDRVRYRADGQGYLEDEYRHVFVLPVEGGTPRQLTEGPYNHGDPAWLPDGSAVVISANRKADWEYDPADSEVYQLGLDGSLRALTDRHGPDANPVPSPDSRRIAYLGNDERYQGYQLTRLYVMDRDGSGARAVAPEFDRDIGNIQWDRNGSGLYFQYDDEGNTKVGHVSLDGRVRTIAEDVGGLPLGRPYAGGQYSVAPGGTIAFTHSRPDHPADVAVAVGGNVRRLTRLNDDLLAHKRLGEVEEVWYESSYDGRRIQGWIVKPPNFDPSREYPMILEIHGGPFANYGDRFAAEIQLYAAQGYVVLYTNPRGSTSYGEEFGNLIHHAYPSQDYDDLMSGVEAVIARGYVDPDRLFVTGGSGGGVLTAWIVGHTDRFRAAAVQKPVINWYSFVLSADGTPFFYKYWFPGFPWDHTEHYMARSPIQYAGNVSTPTMLITGEEDWRTPMWETEQFYEALKLRKVPTAMVRVPDASHGIANRPSNLIAKVAYILGWFERYREGGVGERVSP
jgi:dipeptidyl aminopeptidase/acylaminoacyl peptidase